MERAGSGSHVEAVSDWASATPHGHAAQKETGTYTAVAA